MMYGRINEMLCNKKLYAEYRDSESIITLIILYVLKVNVQDLNMHLITHPQTFFPHQ